MSHRNDLSLRHLPHFGIAVLSGFVLHELAHFGMGRALGYEMWVGINKAGPAEGVAYSSEWHAQLVTAAGPAATLVIAAVSLWFVFRKNALWAFPFLLFSFMMRVMAAAVSILNPNDEAAVSSALGIGTWTLPAIAVGLLLAMVVMASRRLGLSWKSWLLGWFATSAGITAVVLTEPHWPVFGA